MVIFVAYRIANSRVVPALYKLLSQITSSEQEYCFTPH